MHELSSKFFQIGEVQLFFREVLKVCLEILQADAGTIRLVENKDLKLHTHLGFSKECMDYFLKAENSYSPSLKAFTKGERVMINDLKQSYMQGTPHLAVLEKESICSMQSTPLRDHKNNLIGVLSTHWKVEPVLSELDLQILDLLCRRVADFMSIKNSEQALKEKVRELEIITNHVIERELKMVELKNEIDGLKNKKNIGKMSSHV